MPHKLHSQAQPLKFFHGHNFGRHGRNQARYLQQPIKVTAKGSEVGQAMRERSFRTPRASATVPCVARNWVSVTCNAC